MKAFYTSIIVLISQGSQTLSFVSLLLFFLNLFVQLFFSYDILTYQRLI